MPYYRMASTEQIETIDPAVAQTIRDLLRKNRNEQKYPGTLEELGSILGVTDGFLSLVLTGKRHCHPTLERIQEVLPFEKAEVK